MKQLKEFLRKITSIIQFVQKSGPKRERHIDMSNRKDYYMPYPGDFF